MEIEHIYGADVEVVRVMMMTCILVSSDIPRRVRALSGPKRTVLIYSGSKRGKKIKDLKARKKKEKKGGLKGKGYARPKTQHASIQILIELYRPSCATQ